MSILTINEIWIDIYALTRFLAKHTQPVHKVEGTKEWVRTSSIIDPQVERIRENKASKNRLPESDMPQSEGTEKTLPMVE